MWPTVEERIASAVAAALRQDRMDRRERRRLRHVHGAPPARSRSPRPRGEEVLFPEDWPSPSEGPSAASPSPASTRSKYGGVPAPPSTSSGRSRSAPEEELRAVERASRDAASDAAWQEEEQVPRRGGRSFRPGGGAGLSGSPAAPPPPPPTRKGSSRSVPEDELTEGHQARQPRRRVRRGLAGGGAGDAPRGALGPSRRRSRALRRASRAAASAADPNAQVLEGAQVPRWSSPPGPPC